MASTSGSNHWFSRCLAAGSCPPWPRAAVFSAVARNKAQRSEWRRARPGHRIRTLLAVGVRRALQREALPPNLTLLQAHKRRLVGRLRAAGSRT